MSTADSATVLLRGEWPDQPPWVINEAVSTIALRIARGSDTPSDKQIVDCCKILRANTFFDSIALLAATHTRHGGDSAAIRSLGIQSSIELNAFAVAEAEANACAERARQGHNDYKVLAAEFDGQLARILKQRFVQELDPDDLRRAIDLYSTRYSKDSSAYWHGINTVALIRRAQRDYPKAAWVAALPDPTQMAERVYATSLAASADRHHESAEWLFATLSEASMSMGREAEAELWLYRLLSLPKRSLFATQSYQRQLREIWGANAYAESPSNADALARIIAENTDRRFDKRSFSTTELESLSDSSNPTLEKNFSGEGFFSVDSVRNMLESCRAIGCVTTRLGIRKGTGFLVEAKDLDPMWDSGLVFVTNSHVVDGTVPGSLHITEALVTFDIDNQSLGAVISYAIDRILFSSPPGPHGVVLAATDALDVTICVLKDLPSKSGLPIAAQLPLINESTRAYIIGHPRGAEIQVSLHDSRILCVDRTQRLVHYRTPTDPGSSGSPVFNRNWKLIALHHAGSSRMPKFDPLPPPPHYEANEGVSFVAIRNAIRARNNVSGNAGSGCPVSPPIVTDP